PPRCRPRSPPVRSVLGGRAGDRLQPVDPSRRGPPRGKPQRFGRALLDGPVGGVQDPRGPSAVRRLVPVPVARGLTLPPLSEPSAHRDGVPLGTARNRSRLPVDAVSVALALAYRRVLRD